MGTTRYYAAPHSRIQRGTLVALEPGATVTVVPAADVVIGTVTEPPNDCGVVEVRRIDLKKYASKDEVRRRLLEHASPEVREFEDAVDVAWKLTLDGGGCQHDPENMVPCMRCAVRVIGVERE